MFGLRLVAVHLLASTLWAAPLEVSKIFELLKKGVALSPAEAEKLEQRLPRKPEDAAVRVQLLSYYTNAPETADLAAVKAARARHIHWLIEADPKDLLGLAQVATGVHRLNCRGDRLADPAASARAGELWLEQVRKSNGDSKVRANAAEAALYCQPDEAERLYTDACDNNGLGRLYASAILGLTGHSYKRNEPSGSDATLRQSPFAEKARRAIASASDKDLLARAAITLLREGADLWADGKLDWDYTSFGKALLRRARTAGADDWQLVTLPTELPAPGERPPLTLRIGGNVQAAKMVRIVRPTYPPAAKSAGLEGTVRFQAVLGLDGAILHLKVVSGPADFIPASTEAVRQWLYSPTLLNGKPCYVLTQIDVNYTLSR